MQDFSRCDWLGLGRIKGAYAGRIFQFEYWNLLIKTATPEILAIPQTRKPLYLQKGVGLAWRPI